MIIGVLRSSNSELGWRGVARVLGRKIIIGFAGRFRRDSVFFESVSAGTAREERVGRTLDALRSSANANPKPAVRMRVESPKGFLGAVLGALGATSLVAVARNVAIQWFSPPLLPGAELAAGDSKAATFAEAATFLIAVPLAALLFGRALPKLLESRFPRGRLSFEWIPLGAALWLPLWRRGLHLKTAIISSLALSILIMGFILAFRNSPRLRRFFVRSNRSHLFRLAFAGAAWDLARRSDPSHNANLVGDPLIEVVVSAAIFLALAVLAVDRTGHSRRLSSRLRRLASLAPLSVCFSALALVFWRRSPMFLAAALLLFTVPFALKRIPFIRHAFKLAVLVFLLSCGATIYYQPFAPIDLYEDGHRLTYAQSYLRGAKPYLETSPIHGWGYDGGVDAFAFRLTGASLETFRTRSALTAALTLACAAVACFAAFGSAGWSIVAFLLTLSFCPFVSERQLLVFGSLSLLAWGARTGRKAAWILAGVLAGWEIFFSLDMGLILLLGGLFGVVLRPWLESGWRRANDGLRQSLWFLLGVAAGALPFLSGLAARGAFSEFIRVSFREIPAIASDTWGLPAGSLTLALRQANTVDALARVLSGETMIAAFLIVVLTVTGIVYLQRAIRGAFDHSDGVTWLFFAIACVALRGALGRADAGHAALYGVFAAVPIAWLLRRALGTMRWSLAFSLALALLLLVRLHPLQTLGVELGAVSEAARNRALLAANGAPGRPGGHAGLPREQAEELAVLKTYLDARLSPDETFFDFSNEPGLYFFTGRAMPIRFLATPFYETTAGQDEVIQALERNKPPVVILASGTWTDMFDQVPNRRRAPLVATYLDTHYTAGDRVSRWTIGVRR